MELTNTFRSTNAGTSPQTNFGSIPCNNGVTGRLSEDKLSAAELPHRLPRGRQGQGRERIGLPRLVNFDNQC